MASPKSKPGSARPQPDRSQAVTTQKGGPESPASAEIPAEAVEVLRGELGIDLRRPEDVQRLVATVHLSSVSSSPYPSPEMLFAYEPHRPGFADKIIQIVDEQRAHRQFLEKARTERQEDRLDRGQRSAQWVAILGVVGALGAGYLGVSAWICGVVVVMAIGGPNAATVASRLIDRRPKE